MPAETATVTADEESKTKEQLYKDVESMYLFIKNSIDHREEPLEEFKKFSAFLDTVIENPNVLSGYEKIFYEEVSNGILKRLSKERSNDKEERLFNISI